MSAARRRARGAPRTVVAWIAAAPLLVAALVACTPAPPAERADSGDAGTGAAAASTDTATADATTAATAGLVAGAAGVVYACPDGFRFAARFRGDSALVELPARELALPLVPAASGARYEAGGAVLWTKGAEARLEQPEGTHAGCMGQPADTPWEAARLLGVEFRGVGQEPGWLLDVDRERWIRYVGDYGETRVLLPAPAPVRDTVAGTVTYRARTEAHALTVTIRETPCRDVMSGEPFDYTVTVQLDGRDEVRGCGRALVAEPFAPAADDAEPVPGR